MTQHKYPRGCFFKTKDDIRGKKITVMGLGLNGGGLATVQFFLRHGAHVIATDMKSAEQLAPTIKQLEDDDSFDHSLLSLHLGTHDIADFENADCVIKNPGVKFQGNKFLAAAVAKNRAIETDLSVFLHFCRSPIIAVTGSKGKSSTVSAIYHGLCECGFTAFLGGNITVSPLTFLEETNENTPVVLELSSWQLADLRGRGVLKPKISVITKIVPDHMNWYGNMTDYVADKKLIYADQDENDFSIFDFSKWEASVGDFSSSDFAPPDNAKTWGDIFARETKAKVIDPNKMNISLPALKVPGEHNRINALNAATALCLMGIEQTRAVNAIASWQGIPHRLQYFHTWQKENENSNASEKNIRFYNDSAATVPEAAAAAIKAFDEPIIFITGGTDKGLSFEPLAAVLANATANSSPTKALATTDASATADAPALAHAPHIARLYLLAGTGTDKLTQLLDERNIKHGEPFASLQSLLGAIYADEKTSPSGAGVTVFSPGATSFGMFSNEFDRGNKFMDMVKNQFTIDN